MSGVVTMSLLRNLNQLRQQAEKEEEGVRRTAYELNARIRELEILGGSIRKTSKESINASVNYDLTKSKAFLDEARNNLKNFYRKWNRVKSDVQKISINLRHRSEDLQGLYKQAGALENDFGSAREEFYEASILYFYFKYERRMLEPKELLFCDFQKYAGALCDFVGELARRAKHIAMEEKKNIGKIHEYHKDAIKISNELANFSFSNRSGIRTKVNELLGHIQRIESILYDLTIH